MFRQKVHQQSPPRKTFPGKFKQCCIGLLIRDDGANDRCHLVEPLGPTPEKRVRRPDGSPVEMLFNRNSDYIQECMILGSRDTVCGIEKRVRLDVVSIASFQLAKDAEEARIDRIQCKPRSRLTEYVYYFLVSIQRVADQSNSRLSVEGIDQKSFFGVCSFKMPT